MFKDNLKYHRQKNRLSQTALAKRLFVTRQTVSKWEQGINEPDIDTLKKMSDIFGVSVDCLLSDAAPPSIRPKVSRLNRTMLVANILLSVACVMTVFVLYRFLPEIIPAHMTHGVVDRYGNKNEVLLHIISFAVYLAVDLFIYLACKKFSDIKIAAISHVAITIISIGYEIFVLAFYVKHIATEYYAQFIICTTLSFMFSMFAAMSPKITPKNNYLGVRTCLTLGSDAAWNKINTFAAIWLCSTTAVIFAINMILGSESASFALLAYIIPAAAICIYHAKTKSNTPQE